MYCFTRFHSLCFDLVHFTEDSVLDPVDELEGVDGEGGGGEEEDEDHQPHDQIKIKSGSDRRQMIRPPASWQCSMVAHP